MALFERTFQGLYVFEDDVVGGARELAPLLCSATEYWCGLKSGLRALREGIRPSHMLQQQARQQLADMSSSSSPVVSVHLRNYDGLCKWKLPDICHHRSQYQFNPNSTAFGCNQTLTREYLDHIKQDLNLEDGGNKFAIFLSSDRQLQSVDDSFLHNRFGIQAHLPTAVVGTAAAAPQHQQAWLQKHEYAPTTEMFADMWTSVLADYHVGMLRSSCDRIVAEWRAAEGKRFDSISPKQCFEPYYNKQQQLQEEEGDLCPHVRYLGLDTFAMPFSPGKPPACQFLLALGVALGKAKAHNMGQLHLYGDWGRFAQGNVIFHSSSSDDVDVVFRDEFDDLLLLSRRQIYNSGKLRGSGVNATNQAECARGRAFPLRFALRPQAMAMVESNKEEEEDGCGPCAQLYALLGGTGVSSSSSSCLLDGDHHHHHSVLFGVQRDVFWNCP